MLNKMLKFTDLDKFSRKIISSRVWSLGWELICTVGNSPGCVCVGVCEGVYTYVYIHIYIYIYVIGVYIYIYIYVYVCVYIYIERERDRERYNIDRYIDRYKLPSPQRLRRAAKRSCRPYAQPTY